MLWYKYDLYLNVYEGILLFIKNVFKDMWCKNKFIYRLNI